ncbi:MAG: glycosyltransferase family 4 protein [Chloroflexi bacterium]|nr:glycosyltransferase family 4 protein [Chloroflexota bacterium]
MSKPVKVFYYNTFLPMKLGEGMVSRHFFNAATRLGAWQLTTVPPFSMENFLAKGNGRKPTKSGLRGKIKHLIPPSVRKTTRKLASPMSPIPIAPRLYARKMTQRIDAAIEAGGPFDVMLLHISHQDLETLARLCRRATIPIVLRAPGPLAYQADHVFKRYISRRDRQNERFLYDAADAICVISEDMKQLFVQVGVPAEKIIPVPNGIDFANFAPQNSNRELTREMLGLDGSPTVGYIGGFWSGNDMDTLLRAWAKIEAEQPEARLLLVGDGPKKQASEALSVELGLKNCVWTGRVPHTEAPKYISAMDIGVGPYTQEALAFVSPLKVIEYAAMGLPVVAACGGQIQDLIEHGATGYTYQAGSDEEMADAILQLLQAPDQAKLMGQEARQRLESGWHNWDEMAAKIYSICENVTK